MKNIKHLIDQRQQEVDQLQKGMVRPFFNVEEGDFKSLFEVEANNYIIKNGGRENFNSSSQIKECKINSRVLNGIKFIDLIELLHAYLIGNAKGELDVKKGVLICGSYGVGKTMMLTSFMNVFNHISERKKITKIHSGDIAKFIFKNEYDNLIKRPLYIEDVGREAEEVNHYGTVHYPFYNLILDRYKVRAWTFACSNMSPDDLREQYGGYIADRMRVLFNVIEVVGTSKRR